MKKDIRHKICSTGHMMKSMRSKLSYLRVFQCTKCSPSEIRVQERFSGVWEEVNPGRAFRLKSAEKRLS